jgi:hypothetical protein
VLFDVTSFSCFMCKENPLPCYDFKCDFFLLRLRK